MISSVRFECGGPHFARRCNKKKNNDKKFHEASANLCNEETALYSAFFAENSTEWYFDSGATSHMSRNNENLMNKREPVKKHITVANSNKISVHCAGDINQVVKIGKNTNELLIKNVQYVPDLCVNLLSVSQIVKKGNTVVFSEDGCIVYNKENRVIATGSLENDLFKLNTTRDASLSAVSSDSAFGATNDADITLWHRRLDIWRSQICIFSEIRRM